MEIKPNSGTPFREISAKANRLISIIGIASNRISGFVSHSNELFE
jgi:hypothetical protein